MTAKSLLVSAVLLLGLHSQVSAGTTVAYGSTTSATNLTSTGAPMDERFVFQLGGFTNGFIPSPENTAGWLENWRAVTDPNGQVLPGSTSAYSTDPIGGIFPDSLLVNAFFGSVVLEHNTAPFEIGAQLYIWGYDQRATPGEAEWILITDPSWQWPDSSGIQPAISFSVANASTAVLGTINSGVQMRTAAVSVQASSANHYEGWLARFFPEELIGDPSRVNDIWGDLADPDADGVANLVEYFTGANPAQTSSAIDLQMGANGSLLAVYDKAPGTVGVEGWIEWSTDLQDWHKESVVEVPVEGSIQASLDSVPAHRQCYFRLVVRRSQ